MPSPTASGATRSGSIVARHPDTREGPMTPDRVTGALRCITERERRRALQVRVNAGADGARPGSFAVLYRTTQSDNAVQDTERSAD